MRRHLRGGWAACAALAWLSACQWAEAGCERSASREDALARVGPRGELVLASGARAVLDGLRWPDDPAAAERAAERLMRFSGRPLTLTERGAPDRWGRARIDAVTAGEPVDLAGDLVEAGLAAVDAGESDALCRQALLGVEAGARAALRGLWADARPDARDGAALRALAGRFAVVEGRVRNVGERPARAYLNFVARGEDGLTVTVSKRTWRQLKERGFSAASLAGRRVRARGIIEIWRGPTLDVASADMIEVLDSRAGRSLEGAGGQRDGEQAPRR